MGKLSRLIGLASEALDKNTGSGRSGQPADGSRSTDWGGMLRGAVDAVRGPADPARPSDASGRPAPADPYAPPTAPGFRDRAANAAPASGDPYAPPASGASRAPRTASDADRAAIARYDYLVQTADPQQIEQIHREAFARLTPEQRILVEARMREEFAPGERPRSSSPDDLARAAGRAEALKPGRMRGLLSRVRGAGVGGAAVVAGGAAVGLLGAVAGGAVLSTVAGPLLEQAANIGVDFGALAEGVDVEALASGIDVEALAGGAEGILGSAGEAASGLGDAATGWGERLGDLGIPGIGDIFGR
ncbi:cation-transporting ATPase [Microbacterium sp. MYb62]|uniref:cation-transporting ATPase n=1 Tax=Microbacterium sp. MYb62 TaxID=1848690 RepID=UPI000CFE113A|nr:cation-transporting ATPase [Microbacterium sp. MYb62]PRB16633.1 cation-transporting ATPase [Microbacterium sp. MYb62]